MPEDQRLQIEKENYSHLMITSANEVYYDDKARGEGGEPLNWENHPTHKNKPIQISNTISRTNTGPPDSNMYQYPSDLSWAKTGGMSLDGLFIPYSTNFKIVSERGSSKDVNKPREGSLPSYERPYSTEKDGKANDIVNIAEGAKNAALGTNAPSPKFITSVSLNPFASGHHINVVNKNEDITNPVTSMGGYAKHSSNLVSAQETSVQTTRPVGLRGPLVLAGWGYDIHDRPVPNMRFDADNRYDEPTEANYGRQRYVSDQMKGKTQSGMQQDYKHFIPQHMQRQDKWKVGPIDLRWDNQRKVWVGGKHNGIYLSKAAKCIMPQAGIDGNNSFNFGVGGNVNAPGRLYRNPCPTSNCTHTSYFPTSIYYPDIEIYDPEDHNWCGRCMTYGKLTACGDFKDACVPFYDALILRPIDEFVGERNQLTECTDKFRKVQGGAPQMRRAGNPCHGWGSSYFGEKEYINEKIGKDETWTQQAKSLMYEKIFIENPLGQGLMVGDAFFSYDTGKRIIHEYVRSIDPTCGQTTSTQIKVKEAIPVHIILQAEFFGMEIITHAGCDRGEMSACSQKFFAQGFATGTDCGPDDDYPQTAGI